MVATGFQVMIFSVSEIQALLRKAAMGAGVPQGPAEDLAALVRRVARSDAAFWEDVCVGLTPSFERAIPVENGDELIFPSMRAVIDAPSAIDAALCGQLVRVESIDAPRLLVELVGAAEDHFQTRLIDAQEPGAISLRLSQGHTQRKPLAPQPRLEIPETVMEVLQRYAARTYVPASAASRAGGAGAGLNDND